MNDQLVTEDRVSNEIRNLLIFLGAIFLCWIIDSNAEMYFDARAKVCFTYPATKDIDAVKYNEYAEELYWDLHDLNKERKYTLAYIWRLACINARKKADAVNTPTARKFIEDLALIPTLQDFEDMLGFPRQ